MKNANTQWFIQSYCSITIYLAGVYEEVLKYMSEWSNDGPRRLLASRPLDSIRDTNTSI